MTTRNKKIIYLAFGLAVSAVLFWMLFRNIDIAKLFDALKEAQYAWLIPNILFIILTMYQRAYRWKYMLLPIKRVSFHKLLAATCVGFMANNVLPLRLGEFVRAYSLSSQDRDISKSASLATIFVERMVFDLVALLLIFGAVITFATGLESHLPERMKLGTTMAISIALVGIVLMLILALKPSQVGNLMAKYLFFLPERVKDFIKTVIVKFSHGLQFITDLKAVANVGAQTLLIWIFMGISNYFVFKAFQFDIPLDASFVLLVVVSILILVPSTPGFLGVYHLGVVLSLRVYGIGEERALSCALVLHATQYIVVTLMGLYYLKTEHLSLKDLENTATEGI